MAGKFQRDFLICHSSEAGVRRPVLGSSIPQIHTLLLGVNNQPCHSHPPHSYFSSSSSCLFVFTLPCPPPPFTSLPPYLEEADCEAGTVRCVPATVNLASVPPWIWIHLQVLNIIRHWSVERGTQLQVGRKMLGKQVGLWRLADRWPL